MIKANKEIRISQELVQTLLNYLATKPFSEVAPLIGKIQTEVNKQTDLVEDDE